MRVPSSMGISCCGCRVLHVCWACTQRPPGVRAPLFAAPSSGAALSFTAFPVLAAILESAQLLRDPLGTLAFSCAAIDDVVAWYAPARAAFCVHDFRLPC
jgi:Kef-type K+ transport system membrane component KefB